MHCTDAVHVWPNSCARIIAVFKTASISSAMLPVSSITNTIDLPDSKLRSCWNFWSSILFLIPLTTKEKTYEQRWFYYMFSYVAKRFCVSFLLFSIKTIIMIHILMIHVGHSMVTFVTKIWEFFTFNWSQLLQQTSYQSFRGWCTKYLGWSIHSNPPKN